MMLAVDSPDSGNPEPVLSKGGIFLLDLCVVIFCHWAEDGAM